MIKYEGGVFFVDILGFSALTKGLAGNITELDFEAWGIINKVEQHHSFLAASIIVEFRDVLKQLINKYPQLNVGQLSDCAFIWTDDIEVLLKAVHFVMWKMVEEKGILCRGGISFGDIVEIDNNDYKLGAFIVGDAATKAVKNEGRLKGARVTMDNNISDKVFEKSSSGKIINSMINDVFYPITSEIDLTEVDEYRWYLCKDDFIFEDHTGNYKYEHRLKLTKERLKLAKRFSDHPRFGWNSRSQEGLLQLKASLKSITANNLLKIKHDYETSFINGKTRSELLYSKLSKEIDVNQEFSELEEVDLSI